MRSPLLATAALGALLFGACGRGEVVFETSNVANPQTSALGIPSPSDGGGATTSVPDAGKHHVPVIEFDLDRPRGAAPQLACDASICPSAGDPTCPNHAPYPDPFDNNECVQCITSENCLADFGPERAVCEDSECRSCSADSECPVPWECEQGTCIGSCEDNHDCEPNWFCDDGECTTGTLPAPPNSQL